jgi:hypothetical protein
MLENVGTIDRILRIVVGIALVSLYFFGPQTAWGWIGVIPLGTAMISWCPIYKLIDVNTFGKPHSD